jgi:hypothetical protein
VSRVWSGIAINNDERRRMPHRDAEAVLTDWHAVQRDLDEALFGSAEARRLHAEADRLRREYQALINEARKRGLPPVPPFPDQGDA